MSEGWMLMLSLLWPMIVGLLLGVLFFGGLWWTVNKGVTYKHAALLFQSSLLLRTVGTVSGFYFVGDGELQRILACLFGFVIVRLLVTRFSAPKAHNEVAAEEGTHAVDA